VAHRQLQQWQPGNCGCGNPATWQLGNPQLQLWQPGNSSTAATRQLQLGQPCNCGCGNPATWQLQLWQLGKFGNPQLRQLGNCGNSATGPLKTISRLRGKLMTILD
jgi:hypothetical protein